MGETRASKAHHPAHQWQTCSQLDLFTFFPRSATILLAVWSANGDDGGAPPTASSKGNLLKIHSNINYHSTIVHIQKKCMLILEL